MTSISHSGERAMFSFSDNDRPQDCLTATMHYLVLGSTEPQATADFYQRAMGYRLSTEGDRVIARAAGRTLILAPGVPNTLIEAGFLLPDTAELARLRARIDAAGHPREDGGNTLLADAVGVRDPDGNLYRFGVAATTEPPPVDATRPASLDARLQHVVLASRDPRRIVRFFVEVLGFTVSDDVLDAAGDLATSFLRCSVEHHSFAVFRASEDRFDHHCYETRDWNSVRDWADHLASEHIRLQWGPGRHGPGNNLFIFFHDPIGNWVELSAELERVTHDRPVGAWAHEERTLNSWGPGKLRS